MTMVEPGQTLVRARQTVVARRPPTGLDRTSRLPVYVTRDEARAIINATDRFRDRLLLETIWQTGGRISEVLRLRPAHVNLADGAIELLNLKQRGRGGHAKIVWVSQNLCAQLKALARDLHVPADGYLFATKTGGKRPLSRYQAYRLIAAAAKVAGVFKLSPRDGRLMPAWPHTFRHGAAKHLLEQTLRLDYVQDQLGHASLNSTRVYLRLSDADKKRLRDQVSY